MQERGSHDSLDLISVSASHFDSFITSAGLQLQGRSQHLRKGGSKMEYPQNTREGVVEIGEHAQYLVALSSRVSGQ